MNRMLLVSLIALTLATTAPAPARAQAPALRKGVSVHMVMTQNASPVPEADEEDAWVVTVAADGSFFFGADPMSPDELAEWMRTHPRSRDANLYVKADARAPFANVEKALEIGHAMGFEAPVLLTAQTEHIAPGTMVPPKGLEVLVGEPTSGSVVVQIDTNQSMLKVNNRDVAPSALQNTLRGLLQDQTDKLVAVKADGTIPFARVASVVDTCRSIGAKAVLTRPEL